MSSYETTKLTHADIAAANAAVDDYLSKADGLYEELQGTITKLLGADVFSGDAAVGFKHFYDTNVTPVLTDSVSAVCKGMKDILTGVETALLNTVDPGLKDFNMDPSAAAAEE